MLSRTQQTVLAQVRIPLCHDNAGMAQYLLHFVQAATRVDKKAGKAVAQSCMRTSAKPAAVRAVC